MNEAEYIQFRRTEIKRPDAAPAPAAPSSELTPEAKRKVVRKAVRKMVRAERQRERDMVTNWDRLPLEDRD
jgi:hypothetical protein